MRTIRNLLLAGAATAMAPAHAADGAISIKDPAAFRAQLTEMGYAPEPVEPDKDGGSFTILLHLKSETLAVVVAGCQSGRNCGYAALVGSFADLKAPAKWVGKMNGDYDLIKLWTQSDGKVSYASGFPIEGIPRAAFRAWVDGVVASSDDVGRAAISAGYGPKQ